MNYFAYGSNMSLARLRARVPSAERLGVYRLHGYDLRFHKIGRDGSAKCDAFFTGDMDHVVHGVLFHMEPAERAALDRAEDLGRGYRDRLVGVVGDDGAEVTALTYHALLIDDSLAPYSWYLDHVLVGAIESGLPQEYIAALRCVSSLRDHDVEREARERKIHYRSCIP